MKLKLSICIINNCEKRDLWSCALKIKDIADELLIVNFEPGPIEDKLAGEVGVPVYFVSKDGNLQNRLTSAIQKANGEWILMIKSDEILTPQSVEGLRDLIGKGKESAFVVTCQRQAGSIGSERGLGRYEWVGNRRKFQTPEIQKCSMVSDLEVRIFKRKWFKQMLIHTDGSLIPVFRKALTTIPISSIRIEQYASHGELSEEITENEKYIQDYWRYKDELEENLARYEGFEFLGPKNFGYSIIDETHYPSLVAGLEEGWGSVEILRFMLLFFIKEGAYDTAIEFASKITSKLGDQVEIWRLKGDAFFLKLDLSSAEACYQKVLSLKEDYPEILFNLAKVYLILGKFAKGKEILLRLRDMEIKAPEIDFFISSLNEKTDETPKLSLLMICKDEEDYIAKSLGSVMDVVDEMIVVDTGSKDRTRSIAKEFGATVIEHLWKDDFSDARNAGLANATGDYILWMDADEFIERESQISLLVFKNLLSLEKKMGVVLQVESFKEEQKGPNPLPPEKVIKRTAMFPHLPEVCFSGRIFESINDSLDALKINRVLAENIRFLHISENAEQRKERKRCVLNKCACESLPPKNIFKGILFWLDMGNLKKAEEWFERVVSDNENREKHADIIGLLANTLAQNDRLKIDSPVFDMLLSGYQHSYLVLSLCANMFYQAGFYKNAEVLFTKILYGDGGSSSIELDKKSRFHNLSRLAAVYLENDNFEACDKIFKQLTDENTMYDTLQALQIYSEIRKRNVDAALTRLDSWIRARHLTIKATINNFIDMVDILIWTAEIMTSYGQIFAAEILGRSGQYLMESIHIKE